MPRNSFDFQEDYDDYIENTPLEARFDPSALQVLVTEAIPKHAAYGMMFDDYIKARSRFSEYDDSEKKRLSFYVPLFPSMISSDIATEYRISHHKFMVMMIELGLITFQYDYHEQYSTIKNGRTTLPKLINSETRRIHYVQLDKQTISLGSTANARDSRTTKHYSPQVHEWLYNAVSDCAVYMNMSMSDLIYLSLCIGINKTLPNDVVPPILTKDILEILSHFNVELGIYCDRISEVTSKINACW